jgi:hypothetical protein
MNLRDKLELRAIIRLFVNVIERLAKVLLSFKKSEPISPKPRPKILPWRNKNE